MIFSKTALATTFALAASALPQPSPSSTSTSASTSASSSPSASPSSGAGGGSVNIINNLNSTVYVWSTASTTGTGGMQTLKPGGGSYNEDWKTTSDGSGISIKMSTSQNQGSVLQFEYTNDGDKLFWDLSSIDLDETSAFVKAGFSATPDDSSCQAVSCAAGDADCTAVYQKPDDVNTNSCSSGAGLTVTLG